MQFWPGLWLVTATATATTATTAATAATAGRTAGIATSASTGGEQEAQSHYTKEFAAHGDAPGYWDRQLPDFVHCGPVPASQFNSASVADSRRMRAQARAFQVVVPRPPSTANTWPVT